MIKTGSDRLGDAVEIKKDGKTLPEAKPDSGYAFVGWDTTGDGAADYADNESLKNAEVSGELTVKPVYVPAYNVKFTSGPNGSISGRDAFAGSGQGGQRGPRRRGGRLQRARDEAERRLRVQGLGR